ncbi:unnamed protein product, partial [Urochloa humidicola]
MAQRSRAEGRAGAAAPLPIDEASASSGPASTRRSGGWWADSARDVPGGVRRAREPDHRHRPHRAPHAVRPALAAPKARQSTDSGGVQDGKDPAGM